MVSTGRAMGRPPKPTEVKRLLGNPGGRALPDSPAPHTALDVVSLDSLPIPPSDFGVVAVGKWAQIWAAGRRHLSESQDCHLVERLCRVCERMAALDDWLGADPERGWYETAAGQVVTHPSVTQQRAHQIEMVTMLSMLGFSPSDRSRLGLAEVRVANELDEYRKRTGRVVDATAVLAD